MQPSQLGPYSIGTRLGRGGMGAVFEATDEAGHRVAVKVLASHLADDPGLRRRFDSEIATLKTLRHPGIVHLLAFGEDDDQPYFAMELVEGQSLEQMLRSGRRFTWQETVGVALAVTRALKVAHDHGVVHRDLKPANLLIAKGDDRDIGGRVKLADFGIAKLFGAIAHTAHGNIVGTAEYMAPEQAAGRPVDHRVDLYALGLVMFSMLTGRPPFTGAQASEIIVRQQHEPAPRVSSLLADVPPELDLLIDRLLAKEPSDRPPNALALGRLLTAIEALHQAPARHPDTAVGDDLPLPHDPRPHEVDLFAPTQAGVSDAAAGPASDAASVTKTLAATGAVPDNTTKGLAAPVPAATGSDPTAATVVERAPHRRFTTVAELDRMASAQTAHDRAVERRWQAVAAVVTLLLLVMTGYMLFRTASVDEVFHRIEAAQAAARNGADLRDALPAIDDFLARFPDDPRAAYVRTIARTLALDTLEKRARRRPLGGRRMSTLERDYRAAMERESESPSACLVALQAMVALSEAPAGGGGQPTGTTGDEPSLWIGLAERQIERLGPLADRERAEDAARIADIFRQAEALSAAAAAAAGDEPAALLARRRTLLEGVIDLYGGRTHAAAAVATAKQMLAE